MGYRISWIATDGRASNAVLTLLGLSRTGKFVEYGHSRLSGAALPSGWYLLVARGSNHGILRPEVLSRLARSGCRVVACSISETVMYSSAEEWRDGVRMWHVNHDNQQGLHHLESEGHLPECFQEVQRRCAEDQIAEGGEEAEVDFYFEIPLQTARDIVGFKHDELIEGLEPERFEALTGSVARSGEPWWQLWNRLF